MFCSCKNLYIHVLENNYINNWEDSYFFSCMKCVLKCILKWRLKCNFKCILKYIHGTEVVFFHLPNLNFGLKELKLTSNHYNKTKMKT